MRCVVAEVHNTFGERHAYLLTPDDDGNAGIDKQFYVSPFNDVSGDYAMRFTLTDHHVDVTIALRRAGQHRVRRQLHRHTHAGNLHRRSLGSRSGGRPMTQRVSALIRLHAIRLWWRGLPIVNRPYHVRQEGV